MPHDSADDDDDKTASRHWQLACNVPPHGTRISTRFLCNASSRVEPGVQKAARKHQLTLQCKHEAASTFNPPGDAVAALVSTELQHLAWPGRLAAEAVNTVVQDRIV